LREYLGIDIQMKVVDFEFLIPFVLLDLPMLSLIFFYEFWKGNFKISSKYDYKQNIIFFGVNLLKWISKEVLLALWFFEIFVLFTSMTSF